MVSNSESSITLEINFLSKLHRNRKIIISILSIILVGAAAFIFQTEIRSVLQLFLNAKKLRSIVRSYEPFGFLILSGLQILQVLIAPIPGQVVGTAFGTIYGSYLGFVLGFIGNAIGTVMIVYISKRFGRPAVESILSEESVDKYDNYIESSDIYPFIILINIPGPPDDVICYVAGLSSIGTKRLIVYLSLARAPGLLVLSFFGDGLVESNWALIAGLIVFILLVSIVGFWKYDEINNYLSNKYGRDNLEEEE